MKRNWRPWWILLGVMLLGIAVLVYGLWPSSSWRIPEEDVIGFDEAKGLVYTVQFSGGKHELHGYDVSSGARQKTFVLSPVKSEADDSDLGTSIIWGSHWLGVDLGEGWKWLLSPNKQVLIAVNEYEDHFQLIDLESGQLVRRILYPKSLPVGPAREFGFSSDGALLVLRVGHGRNIVWDLSSGKIIQQLEPSIPTSYRGFGKGYIIRNQMHLCSKQGYLAYADHKQSILHDMARNVDLIVHPGIGIPQILDEGHLVVFTPQQIDAKNKPAWYRRQTDGQWRRMSLDLANEDQECVFVAYTSKQLVTHHAEDGHTKRLSWIPESVWDKANQHFQLSGTRHHFQFWDLRTGVLRRKFSLFEPENTSNYPVAGLIRGYYLNYFDDRLTISESGNWLAYRFDKQLTVWDVTGRRPLLCWLLGGSILALAQWLAWPRSIKETHSALRRGLTDSFARAARS